MFDYKKASTGRITMGDEADRLDDGADYIYAGNNITFCPVRGGYVSIYVCLDCTRNCTEE